MDRGRNIGRVPDRGVRATRFKSPLAIVAALLVIVGCSNNSSSTGSTGAGGALSGNISTEKLHEHSIQSSQGHTLAFAPAGLGLTLTDEWQVQIKAFAEAYGFKYLLRESNWDVNKQVSVLQSLVNTLSAGDVLVVHNSTVSLLAKIIQQAENKGIYVIQLNMASNYKTDAYVATDSIAVGRRIASDVAAACGAGTSGKVAIVQGDLTSEVALDTMIGWNAEIPKYPSVKVVANQSAAWDPTKAHDIIANVLQTNRDLCAVWGQFDEMDQGSAQAIAEAGLTGKVKLFSYGGSPVTCKLIAQGAITKAYSFRAQDVGMATATVANYLVQSGLKPGTARTAIYIPTFVIDSSNVNQPGICYNGKGTGLPQLLKNG